ncbi:MULTISPECIES: tRNA cyclic N6-threonylcarbamoyladenosine(37) synthase TcdA [Pasteurellaceae]|uniref:tRNA threonylcarbamoyladenosine dehydratase n=1 Tax=Pasteurella atlantica TaxID=2827233 RepID=A0AAW8CGG3_9PAST|nr:tRNA cyclic N6-threonylcarbamoyladenosine(37) synthase TcdA [Pasteurella atlantica]MBR0573264.1 tRNA cyclic N6-threonylcarbamoyladenosine(37) synthase TcdA [Pasteurella atlantica]MDP8039120.1 tRNA cyclic N6-threonylcarbamoyladenosine(37) synthase TcdA [Pasteurella atlantica]MDP8041281.1 tRNA cyclic N6-threonylcarbamoyladenosine(37) synthase TcdA [Pasteurella atlantica]MDP8043418.1 tRNA cyclic N6-threonylcarbamoyladenosine(37) synthase TcdA [Pasteurella atlantica]MDP8045504.1 tRNA cyclic N6-
MTRIDNYNQRFGGIGRLYTPQGLEKLRQSHICVIGIGGVGSWAVEALARSGIGNITLIDMDDICVTNINRQIHALSGQIGNLKTEAMQERIKLINPECEVQIIDDFLTKDNLSDYLMRGYDYVIDAIDSVQTKAALIAYCKRNKIKLITTGGAGGQTDPTQIQITDLSKTIQDPLASKVRNILRKEYNFSTNPKRKFGIDCVFSTQPLIFPKMGEGCEVSATMNCANGFGATTVVTATFGFFAVSRVIDKLLKQI